ncbi:NDP-hexose 2,3-dehydratase family protein [Streptomyces sp. WMMC905]|uniref:NDP-hexose 2,3-dehydratase family protein n=1 Tax=Streptomyces sp. WMMC905 TaxID=3404123 RepID=UPI003B922D25
MGDLRSGRELDPGRHGNFTGVHRGRPIPFLDRSRSRVLVDVLQSEQAEWFLAKRNRNMVVEIGPDESLECGDDFRWLTFGQLRRLLLLDNVVNMDTRSILACLPTGGTDPGPDPGPVLRSFFDPTATPVHTASEVLGRLTAIRATRRHDQRRVPLHSVAADGWQQTGDDISHSSGHRFRVIATDITTGNREVGSWTQPLIQPQAPGLMGLLIKRINGVPHALVHARTDVGTLNVAEFSPTVHCRPAAHTGAHPEPAPPYLDTVLTAPTERIRYSSMLSEEGGRFHHAQNRYTLADVPDAFSEDVPEDYLWLTFAQLTELMAHSNYLDVELRTLVVCAHTLY